jgi:hypothetical protein
MKAIFPNHLIETSVIRCLGGAWVIERSVFYIYGVDWLFIEDWEDWTVVVSVN